MLYVCMYACMHVRTYVSDNFLSTIVRCSASLILRISTWITLPSSNTPVTSWPQAPVCLMDFLSLQAKSTGVAPSWSRCPRQRRLLLSLPVSDKRVWRSFIGSCLVTATREGRVGASLEWWFPVAVFKDQRVNGCKYHICFQIKLLYIHYIALHCIALNCIALHCITLHYMHRLITYICMYVRTYVHNCM